MKDRHLLEVWNRYVTTGDEIAFMKVYDTFYEDTLHFATAKCKNSHIEKEEIVDEVWSKLASKKPPIKENIHGYIIRTTQNTFIDFFRKSNKTESYDDPKVVVTQTVVAAFLEKEEAEQRDFEIQECLEEKDYQFIREMADSLKFGYTKQETYEHLAKVFNIAINTVRNNRNIIMKKLKTCRTNRSK